jgi:heat shock protein HslJ
VTQGSRRVLRPIALVGVVFLVALGTSACDNNDSMSGSKPQTTSSTPLVGTNWVLAESSSLGVSLTGVNISIRFGTDGKVSGESGCNSFSGPYTTSGSKMTIGPNLISTATLCGDPADAVERAYRTRISQVQTYTIGGTTLSLFGANDKLLLEYRASGLDALVGHWEVTSYYTGNAIQSVIIGTTLTADFTKATIGGDGGCNEFNGPFTIDGDAITIGPLASTRRACADPAAGTQEQQYLAALELAKTYRVTGDTLELFRGGLIAVTFLRGK